MELNDILNGFAGSDANSCRPVNDGCSDVGGFRGGLFGGNIIWLILLFWLCCGGFGGCGFGGFGGFGGGCCNDHHHHHDECCGNNGCTWIIWIIILFVLFRRDECHKIV